LASGHDDFHFYPDFFPAHQAFLCIALLVGDGLYNFVKVMVISVKNIRERSHRKSLNRGEESSGNICLPHRNGMAKPNAD